MARQSLQLRERRLTLGSRQYKWLSEAAEHLGITPNSGLHYAIQLAYSVEEARAGRRIVLRNAAAGLQTDLHLGRGGVLGDRAPTKMVEAARIYSLEPWAAAHLDILSAILGQGLDKGHGTESIVARAIWFLLQALPGLRSPSDWQLGYVDNDNAFTPIDFRVVRGISPSAARRIRGQALRLARSPRMEPRILEGLMRKVFSAAELPVSEKIDFASEIIDANADLRTTTLAIARTIALSEADCQKISIKGSVMHSDEVSPP